MFKFNYQNKCPHILTTASLAVSRQILHSNILSSFSLFADSVGFDGPGCSSNVTIFDLSTKTIQSQA